MLKINLILCHNNIQLPGQVWEYYSYNEGERGKRIDKRQNRKEDEVGNFSASHWK